MILLRSPLSAIFLVSVIVAGVWGVATLKLQTELLPVLPPSLPSVRGLTEFARLTAGEDNVFAVADPALDEGERIKLLDKIQLSFASVPGVLSVAAPEETFLQNIGVFAAWVFLNSPPEVFSAMVGSVGYEAARERLEGISGELAGAVDAEDVVRMQIDPLGLIAGKEGEDSQIEIPVMSGFLRIAPDHPLNNTAGATEFTDALQTAMDKALGEADRGKVLLTGFPVFTAEISRQMRGDMMFMVATAITLLCGIFYLFYRTLKPLRWIMFFQVLAMLCGIVIAKLLYGGLNVISIGFASILLGVGMDYSILVYHHFAAPHRNDMGVWRTLRRSIWFSAVVTSLSFFLLMFSSFPALRQLAALVGTGLLTTALFATWLLKNVLQANPPNAPEVIFRASGRTARWILRWRGVLICIALVALAGGMATRPWARYHLLYNPDLSELQPVGSNAFKAQQWLSSLDPSEGDAVYLLRGPSFDALRETARGMVEAVNPEAVNPVWRIPSESNAKQNLAIWPGGTTKALRLAFDAEGFGEEWAGPTLQMAGALDAVKSGSKYPFAGADEIISTMAGSDERGDFAIVRISDAAERPVPKGGFAHLNPAVEISPISWVSLTDEITALAQHDFGSLGLAILIGIVALCFVVHRSARLVLLNLVALALSLALFVALLRLTGASLTPISLISMPLLFGLVVDYSLHILLALEHQEGDLVGTYNHLAAPVLLTGLSACIGFGVPMLSGQPALQNFGLVMDLGVIAAVSACLVLLPPLYLIGQKRKDYRERTFYRQLYRRGSFEWIIFGWKLLGKSGAWVISRAIGIFYPLTHPSTVRAVRGNLALLDPEKATFWNACRLFVNQAENFSSYGWLALQKQPSDVLDSLGECNGLEFLKRAREEGRGCLLVTGHFGFFEIGGLVMSQMGYPMVALTLPEPGDGLTEWRAKFRERWGVKTLVVGDGSFSMIEIVKELQGGAFVASLADRPHDENGVLVEAPHGKLRFATGPVLLALLAKCPIIPVSIVRQGTQKFRMDALAYIEPQWMDAGKQETIEYYTKKIAESLIPVFVEHPEQWLHFSSMDETEHKAVAAKMPLH